MKNLTRRELCGALPAVALVAGGSGGMTMQAQSGSGVGGAGATSAMAGTASAGTMGPARVFGLEQMAVRKMANGGESLDIVHGSLATGETVNLHQSMQVVGATPNPLHVIQHSEFIFVREGELEFQHEVAGKIVAERVKPGEVIYVAFGTNHTVSNVGSVPARYFVIAIGGDAK